MSRVYAIVVGVEAYEGGTGSDIRDLRGPRDDAINFATLLQSAGVDPDDIHLFVNTAGKQSLPPYLAYTETAVEPLAAPDWANIRSDVKPDENTMFEAFKGLKNAQGDILVIYWSGHGGIADDNSRRLICSDATDHITNINLDSLLGLLASETISSSCFRKQIIFIDACGGLLRPPLGRTALSDRKFTHSQTRTESVEQWVVFAAQPQQDAFNDDRRRKGFFTEFLREALKGSPDEWDMAEVVESLKQRVDFQKVSNRLHPMYVHLLRGDGSKEELDYGLGRERRKEPVSEAEFLHLLRILAREEDLLDRARKLASRQLPQFQISSTIQWQFLLADICDLPNPRIILGFLCQLSIEARTIRVSPGFALELDAWIKKFAERHDVDIRYVMTSTYWISYAINPDPADDGTFDVAELHWFPDLNGEFVQIPTEWRHDKVELSLEEVVELVKAQAAQTLASIGNKGKEAQAVRRAVEFFVPVEAFIYDFENWASPRESKLGLKRTLATDYPVIRRPIDYASIDNRLFRLQTRSADKGIHFLSCVDVESLARQYDHDDALGYGCVGLLSAPNITPGSGRGDVFAAVLGTGMPAMLWFESPVPEICLACVDSAKKLLEGVPVGDLPKAIFYERNRNPNAAWQTAVLVFDAPERVPSEILNRSKQET